MRRKHHRRYQGCFTRLASLARSLTAPTAAGLLLALVAPLVIMPGPAQAQGNDPDEPCPGGFRLVALVRKSSSWSHP